MRAKLPSATALTEAYSLKLVDNKQVGGFSFRPQNVKWKFSSKSHKICRTQIEMIILICYHKKNG